ncbi:AAA family ATPase [Rhodanobacter umsongensis]
MELEEWFEGRPKWLQTAAAMRLAKATLTNSDYQQLFELCLQESENIDQTGFSSLSPGSLNNPTMSPSVRVAAIHDLKGINALRPGRPLDFALGDNELTVVYGFNGSGKSGYSRLLTHLCGSRFRGDLHSNAFDSVITEQSAGVQILVDGQPVPLQWRKVDGPLEPLRHVHIFDSECASSYVSKSIEAAFEPAPVRFLAELITDCIKVGQKFDDMVSTYCSHLPLFPQELQQSDAAMWLKALSPTTTEAELLERCSWGPAETAELAVLDGDLGQADPMSLAASKKRKKTLAEQLAQKLHGLEKSWSSTVAEQIAAAREQLAACKRVAAEAAQQVFSGAPLTGIGEATWRALWDAAKAYSERVAYLGRTFPVLDDSVCVLCQQSMSAGGKQRMQSFNAFVQGALDAAVVDAQASLERLTMAVIDAPTAEMLAAQFEAIDVSVDVDSLHKRLGAHREALMSHQSGGSLPNLDLTGVIQPIEAHVAELQIGISNLEATADTAERARKAQRRNVLRGKHWLSQQVTAVREEMDRQKALASLAAAKKLTGTNALTQKKNDLAADLLARAHATRFVAELRELGGDRLPIKILPTRGSRTTQPGFQVSLDGAVRLNPSQVLSEGESRIVALAAFMADVTAGPVNVPFIFDDPISSLDQRFEEATARRLIREAKVRQVIVFTHRLSMLALLDDLSGDEGIKVDVVALRGAPEGTGTPGQMAIREKKPEKALNKLLGERLPKARKALADGDRESGEMMIQSVCSDFRVLVERLIEMTLLNGVVQRFQKNLTTKDKLAGLAKIRPEDCVLLESMMTKYSYHEHSQSQETPVPLPSTDELGIDLRAVVDWIQEFSARGVPLPAG